MKLFSFSAKWFTKGLIYEYLICSQYHLVAKECKTSRYITDTHQRWVVQGPKSKSLAIFFFPVSVFFSWALDLDSCVRSLSVAMHRV